MSSTDTPYLSREGIFTQLHFLETTFRFSLPTQFILSCALESAERWLQSVLIFCVSLDFRIFLVSWPRKVIVIMTAELETDTLVKKNRQTGESKRAAENER